MNPGPGIMSKHNEDLLKRPLYAYDLPPEVLDTLTLKSDLDATVAAIDTPHDSTAPGNGTTDGASDNLVGSQACSLCSLTFTTVQDQRSHIRSDLHSYNLKQRLRGGRPATEAEFEKLIGDLDESLSGSDDDDSEADEEDGKQESTLTTLLKKQAKLAESSRTGIDDDDDGAQEGHSTARGRGKPPIVWFASSALPEKHYFGLYRAILTGEDQRNSDLVDVLRKKQLDPIAVPRPGKDGSLPEFVYKGPHIFLCMVGGGHFAAMVVSLAPRQSKGNVAMNREATVLSHKTFHRYTTRRKQGGSQSANDNAKGNAHSAGSSIRRYNEQALVQDIRDLLEEWKALLDTSELLFIRATGATNRRTLFGPYDGQVLKHNDTRLRGFPFSTRRATQKELMRSFIELTRLKVREIDPELERSRKPDAPTPPKTSSPKPSKPKLSEADETALLHTTQIQALIRRSKLPALLGYFQNNNLTPDIAFYPPDQNHHTPYPLHMAAAQNASPLVLGLLTRGNANPGLQNKEGKTAFELTGERSTRDAFRVARSELGEAKWPWEEAKVPAPLTKGEATKRDEQDKAEADKKEAERRKTEEARLAREGPKVADGAGRGKGGSRLGAAAAKTPQEKRDDEARGLTPEMRMRLERERRARAAEERLRRMREA